jgi:hypothetical protein
VRRVERRPIIHGRNFIETLLLTLMHFELEHPSLEVEEYTARRLEEELCSVSYSIVVVRNFYHEMIRRMLSELYPDLPQPEFKSCFAMEEVMSWLSRNTRTILKEKSDLVTIRDAERHVKQLGVRIIRTALKAALYKAGMISVKSQ